MPGVVLMGSARGSTRHRTRRGATPEDRAHQRGRRHHLREGRDASVARAERDRAASGRCRSADRSISLKDRILRGPHQGRPLRSPRRERQLALGARRAGFSTSGASTACSRTRRCGAHARARHDPPGRPTAAAISTARPTPWVHGPRAAASRRSRATCSTDVEALDRKVAMTRASGGSSPRHEALLRGAASCR